MPDERGDTTPIGDGHGPSGVGDPASADPEKMGVPIFPHRADPKWSDDLFLDRLRASTDEVADRTVAELHAAGLTGAESGRLFARMDASDAAVPEESPAAMKAFFAATREEHVRMERGIDADAVRRGKEVFRLYTLQSCVVMLASSLPCGYSAPCLSRVLTVSDDLEHHPYRRLLGVLQLLVNIYRDEAHEVDGYAFLTAQKLRLLHAGIRPVVRRRRPGFEERYGIPVNHEDMLATIMGFSLLVLEGSGNLGVEFRRDQVEDVWYLWRQFARMMGITPAGEPLSEEFVPETIDDAAAFYASYVRRHFADDPADNPDGAALAGHNLAMMRDLLPWWGRLFFGMNRLPLIAMMETLGKKGMARVGLQPLAGHRIDVDLFDFVLRLVLREETRHSDFISRAGLLMLGRMIEGELGGEVTFLIPEDLADVRSLTDVDGPAIDRD